MLHLGDCLHIILWTKSTYLLCKWTAIAHNVYQTKFLLCKYLFCMSWLNSEHHIFYSLSHVQIQVSHSLISVVHLGGEPHLIPIDYLLYSSQCHCRAQRVPIQRHMMSRTPSSRTSPSAMTSGGGEEGSLSRQDMVHHQDEPQLRVGGHLLLDM